MKSLTKIVILFLVSFFVLGCNLPAIVEGSGNESQTQSGEDNEVQSDMDPPDQSGSDDLGDIDFATSVPTEVIVPDGVLIVANVLTRLDMEIDSCRTFVILRNTSSNPLEIVKEFSYTMTWYDDQDQVVDQWDNSNGPMVFPQEVNYWEMWVDEDAVASHNIVRAVFEIKDIITADSIYKEGQVRERILSQALSHPFFTIEPGELILDKSNFLLGLTASSTVNFSSSLENLTPVQILALYYNDAGDWVGIGRSNSFEYNPGDSLSMDVSGMIFTDLPVNVEYYGIVVGSDLVEVIYPGIYN